MHHMTKITNLLKLSFVALKRPTNYRNAQIEFINPMQDMIYNLFGLL
jgi:hypothetical protein